MGTNSLVPYTAPKYRFYFSKQLMIYFWEDNDYIAISYTGKERRGDRRFYKRANMYDIALMEHIRDIVRTRDKLPDGEAEKTARQWADFFDYSPK